MLTQNELYYGQAAPLPDSKRLWAGPLTLIYEGGDLRYLKLGEREILRRIYVAVRDRNWGTVPPAFSHLQIEATNDSFRITYQVENKQDEIDFFWKGTLQGDVQGTITFTFEGQARSTFLSNRIGFCVLHPIRECAGQACRVKQVDGSVTQSTFPKYISPHQPFLEMAGIDHEIQPGLWAEVSFEGDIFEMEDQRNWIDGSYKTYCTPLRLGFPHEIKAGTCLTQSVTLRLRAKNNQGKLEVRANVPPEPLTFSLERDQPSLALPRLGLGVASHGQALNTKELDRLRALNLSHLRVDLRLSDSDYPAQLRQAWREAQALNLSLEVALHLSDQAEAELQALLTQLEAIKPTIWAWLIFHIKEKSTTEKWIDLARKVLAGYDPQVQLGSGTNAYFTELNRGRPPMAGLDLICYSVNPQVHAFDNASLIETLEALTSTVESARQFTGALPLAITPITLKPRFNPDATAPAREPEPGEIPWPVDVRQMSLFGAGWTVGSFKYLAESGVQSLTYYETSGWRGVLETEQGSPAPSAPSWCASARAGDKDAPAAPERFRSLPGSAFPLYHVLADIGEFAGGEILPTRSTQTLHVEGLALRKSGRTRVIVANLQAEARSITLTGLEAEVQLRYLDETNALDSMQSPEAFRSQAGEIVRTAGPLALELRPYATARIDF